MAVGGGDQPTPQDRRTRTSSGAPLRVYGNLERVVGGERERVGIPAQPPVYPSHQRSRPPEKRVAQPEGWIRVSDVRSESGCLLITHERRAQGDAVAAIPRHRIQAGDGARRMEDADGLVEGGEVDGDVFCPALAKTLDLPAQSLGRRGEVRDVRPVAHAVRDLPAGGSKLAPDRDNEPIVTRVVAPDRDKRVDLVAAEQCDQRLPLPDVVWNEAEDVVARDRERVRGTALADHDDAERRSRPPHGAHLRAGLRTNHDTNALCCQPPQLPQRNLGLAQRVDNSEADPQRRAFSG